MYWEMETRAGVKGRDIVGQFYDWLSILTDSFFIGSEIQRFKTWQYVSYTTRQSQMLVFVKSENISLEKKRKKKGVCMRFEVEFHITNPHVKVKKKDFLVELRAL